MKIKTFLIFIFILSTKFLFSDPIQPYSGTSGKITSQDLIPHIDTSENKGNEYYNEWYSFVFYLDSGYKAYVQFVITNLGIGDGDLNVISEFKPSDSPKTIENKSSFSLKDWSYAKDKFYLKAGENVLEGEPGNINIKIKNDKFEAEYNFKNSVLPWKPGNGKVYYGTSKKNYYDFKILAPIAKVAGTIKASGSDSVHNVKGFGYADHAYTNQPMHEQAKRWIRFRGIKSNSAVVLTEFHAPEQYANKKVSWLVIFKGGHKVFSTLSPIIEPLEFQIDEQSVNKYQVPIVFKISAEEEGKKIIGAIKVLKMTHREDILKDMDGIKRTIVSKFAKPVSYYFDCEYAFEMTTTDQKTETFKGKGRYYYTQLLK